MHNRRWVTKIFIISFMALLVLCGAMNAKGHRIIFNNGIFFVNYTYPVGIESPTGKFRLVETFDESRRYVTYTIIGDRPLINVYSTPNWYQGKHLDQALWGKKNDDFFVISFDDGVHLYEYSQDEGTWYANGVLYREKNAYDQIVPHSYLLSIQIDGEWVVKQYDYENIPLSVVDYFSSGGIG